MAEQGSNDGLSGTMVPETAFLVPGAKTIARRRRGRRRPSATDIVAILCAAFLALVALVGVLSPLIAPHSPSQGILAETLQPPIGFGGSWSHPLGTDELGRDILSRLMYGARVSLIIGVGAVGIATIVGVAVGVVAALRGGVVDSAAMRLVELQLAFPTILLALILVSVFQPGLATVFISVVFVYWSYFARVTRADALRVRHTPYVDLAIVAGASPWRIIRKHIIPNVANGIVVLASLQVASAIGFEASLSFLGVGIQPPQASWGSMLGSGRSYVTVAWWLSVVPGIAIVLTVLALNMLGDWIRDRLDPKKRRLD